MLYHKVGRIPDAEYPRDCSAYRAVQEFFLTADALLGAGRDFYWSPSKQMGIYHGVTSKDDIRFPLSKNQIQDLIDAGLIVA